jgi:hypothetical protein
MSVTARIRLVGAIAKAFAMAVGVVVLFGVWASVDALPGMLSLAPAGALIGMFAATSVGVALAMSISLDERGRAAALNAQSTQPLQTQTSYQFPPA